MEIPLDLVTIRYLKLVDIDKDKVANEQEISFHDTIYQFSIATFSFHSVRIKILTDTLI